MIFEDITLDIEDGLAWIRFNRPQVKNAVRGQTMRELCQALDVAIASEEARVIILGAVGEHFVAGAEFAFLEDLSRLSTAQIKSQVYAFFQGAARRLYTASKPTIAAVNGAAITVGCELALACDFRIATDAAVFQETWIRLGLIPPLGGMKLLPGLIGIGRANDMVLRGKAVKGEEAVRIGLAHQLASVEGLEAATRKLALELAAASPTAYAAAKAGLHRGLESSMETEWQANLMAQATLIASADFKEGLAAVQSKRPPVFTGD